jgi:acetyltransferase-like isoleucine patch superfamily enzyme
MSFLPAGVILMSLKMLNLHQWVVLTAALILVVLYGLSLLKKNPQLLKFVIGYMDKLWALFKWVPGLKILYETRNTQTPITFRTWFFQKILGFNHRAYWPVHFTSVVSGVKNIYAGVDTAPGYSPGCYIQGLGKVYIGDYTQIGPNVGIISANHDVYNSRHHQLGEEIRIGKYCWIGMGSVVLPGVVLGDFTIVGAGSVVTKSFPDGYCVIAGNPAKIISFLDKDKCKPFKNDFEYYGYIPKRKFETFREKYLKV